MMVLPFFLVRLGVKWVFVLGMLGWATRYLLFYVGYGSDAKWPLYTGVGVHGICYVFFFVLAYIYVDQKAPEAIRTKAQGFISLVTLGAGFLAGGLISGWIVQQYSFPNAEPVKFKMVQDASRWAEGDFVKWDVNSAAAFGKITKIAKEGTEASKATASVEVFQRGEGAFKPSGKTEVVPLSALSKPMILWDKVWALAAGAAIAILVLFALLFKHQAPPKAEGKPQG
jgi:MFS family permease